MGYPENIPEWKLLFFSPVQCFEFPFKESQIPSAGGALGGLTAVLSMPGLLRRYGVNLAMSVCPACPPLILPPAL